MISKDVPIAFFIGTFPNKTNAGTIANPPPTPTNPVKIPTPSPSVMNHNQQYLQTGFMYSIEFN